MKPKQTSKLIIINLDKDHEGHVKKNDPEYNLLEMIKDAPKELRKTNPPPHP